MRLRIFITSIMLSISGPAFADVSCNVEHLASAYSFIKELEKVAPTHDGVPLRNYSIQDLDFDGCMEVLESVSTFEEQATGLLNVEIYPATEWINVYSFNKGKYREATDNYPWFLQVRRQHYNLWLRIFADPKVLNEDSKRFLADVDNSKQLNALLKGYINKIDKLITR